MKKGKSVFWIPSQRLVLYLWAVTCLFFVAGFCSSIITQANAKCGCRKSGRRRHGGMKWFCRGSYHSIINRICRWALAQSGRIGRKSSYASSAMPFRLERENRFEGERTSIVIFWTVFRFSEQNGFSVQSPHLCANLFRATSTEIQLSPES
jgi:hypothetical protein